MIGRREFIAGIGGAAAWPVVARAQQGERVRRVGFLTYGPETAAAGTSISTRLRDELEKLGWTEGRNLRLDFRFGNGDAAHNQTRIFAADLVHLAPDAIVTVYGVALSAVQQQTTTIPIVLIGAGDVVEMGRVTNSARPEGNVTGFTNAFGSLGGKWLELLKEVAPDITRVLYMYAGSDGGSYLQSVETAARSLGVQVVAISVSDADGRKAAIEAFGAERNRGLLPGPGTLAIAPDELIRLAAQYHLPAIYGASLPPASGALMTYSADPDDLLRGAASYVDRLLRGAKVSELPVQYPRPSKFRLTINLKTAKTIELNIPESVLLRADEVIE